MIEEMLEVLIEKKAKEMVGAEVESSVEETIKKHLSKHDSKLDAMVKDAIGSALNKRNLVADVNKYLKTMDFEDVIDSAMDSMEEELYKKAEEAIRETLNLKKNAK